MKFTPSLFVSAGLALCAFALPWLAPAPASACGGFFCNNSAPVNQNAERIVFVRNADDSVTAVVQIQYSGPSERFAWVLPVPGTPEVGVSSNVVFGQLQAATNPQYILNTTVEGECADDGFLAPSAGGARADAGIAIDSGTAGPPVTVLDRGSVGPFDFVTIALDPSLPDPADVAVSWLMDNGYDVDESGRSLLGPYLVDGMNLVAFRLTKQATAGDIQPIRLSYDAPCPMIPIKLTAVATQPDMPVMVWVFSEHRAVPTNYLSLELNEAALNWLSPNSNYNALVTAAADEAGGQGFVTEMSGLTADLPPIYYPPTWAEDARARDAASYPDEQLIVDTAQQFSGWDGLSRALAATVSVAPGQDLQTVLNCLTCQNYGYPGGGPGGPGGPAGYCDYVCSGVDTTITGFDRATFIDTIDHDVVAPVRETAQLLQSRPHFTRLYTTMSAEDMTLDPTFDDNPDQPDVSNVHTADRVIYCSPDVDRADAPYRVMLADGRAVEGEGTSWPFTVGGDTPETDLPATLRQSRLSTSGEGVLVVNNRGAIDARIRANNVAIDVPASGSVGGCSITHGRGLGVLSLLGLVGLVLFARRRFTNAVSRRP